MSDYLVKLLLLIHVKKYEVYLTRKWDNRRQCMQILNTPSKQLNRESTMETEATVYLKRLLFGMLKILVSVNLPSGTPRLILS